MIEPIPSVEESIPMPDFLFQGMPGLGFDHGDDAPPEECVPRPTFFRWNDSQDALEGSPPEDGSVRGLCPGADDGSRGCYNQNAPRGSPMSKPDTPSATMTRAKKSWWNRKNCAKFDFRSKKFKREDGTEVEDFEDLTVGELKQGFESLTTMVEKPSQALDPVLAPPRVLVPSSRLASVKSRSIDPWSWIDQVHTWKQPPGRDQVTEEDFCSGRSPRISPRRCWASLGARTPTASGSR